jgi:HPt (histidine-containing phosphotransfer) domain-containing protein
MILSCARSLLTLINDILDYSKIEAGRLEIERLPCPLTELLDGVAAMMAPRARQKKIEFALHGAAGLPDIIYTDPARLRQCLVNLLDNALKFTARGHVHLRVGPDTTTPGELIRFDVEDTGIGIPPDKHALIFESFTQADNSTTRKYGGSGLGLAITAQLAQLLGGHVSLRSQPGQGSCFSLYIPVMITPPPTGPSPVEQGHRETPPRAAADAVTGDAAIGQETGRDAVAPVIVSRLVSDPQLRAVAEVFLEELPEMIKGLKESIETADWESLSRLAHDIKGSGGNAGFDVLIDKGLELENAARHGQLDAAQRLIGQLEELLPQLSAWPA